MKICIIFFAFLQVATAIRVHAENCPPNEIWVSAHPRKEHIRADGIFISATHVIGHCRIKSKAYEFLYLLISSGCASTSSSNKDYLHLIQNIPIGADQAKIKGVFGAPDESAKDAENTKLTYFFEYKGVRVPKVLFWINPDGKVTGKYINLFKESNDEMTATDIEKYLGHLNLIVEAPSYKKPIHYIPSERILTDRSSGVSLQIRDENRVQWINWFQPWDNESNLRSQAK